MTLEQFNSLPDDEASEELRACCGSSRWVDSMLARRPFTSLAHVVSEANAVWAETGPRDWREAFAHHPRIGESKAEIQESAQAREWSALEQEGVERTEEAGIRKVAQLNEAYERRFGHIFIVCAAGLRAEDMMAIATQRMKNDPDTELRIASEEQRRITELRLLRLLGD